MIKYLIRENFVQGCGQSNFSPETVFTSVVEGSNATIDPAFVLEPVNANNWKPAFTAFPFGFVTVTVNVYVSPVVTWEGTPSIVTVPSRALLVPV